MFYDFILYVSLVIFLLNLIFLVVLHFSFWFAYNAEQKANESINETLTCSGCNKIPARHSSLHRVAPHPPANWPIMPSSTQQDCSRPGSSIHYVTIRVYKADFNIKWPTQNASCNSQGEIPLMSTIRFSVPLITFRINSKAVSGRRQKNL